VHCAVRGQPSRYYQCKGWRLPTEAEWEYAARAGSTAPTDNGSLTIQGKYNAPELDAIAWYGGNSGVTYSGGHDCADSQEMARPAQQCGPHPVGLKRKNAHGLHDMLGNVWEWCLTNWSKKLPGGTLTNPGSGWSNSTRMIQRGGSWNNAARWLRFANRAAEQPADRANNVGFRPVKTDAQ
jgi:formylglycine-generating enzyme required for sulfatase activity